MLGWGDTEHEDIQSHRLAARRGGMAERAEHWWSGMLKWLVGCWALTCAECRGQDGQGHAREYGLMWARRVLGSLWRVQCLVLNCAAHGRIGGDHLLETEITVIKSWLLRPTHLNCNVAVPADKKTTNQRCSINKRDEGAEGQGMLVVSIEVTWQSHKGWSNQKLQSLPNEASSDTPSHGYLVCLVGIQCSKPIFTLQKSFPCPFKTGTTVSQNESGDWKNPFHSQYTETLFWLWGHNYQGPLNASGRS